MLAGSGYDEGAKFHLYFVRKRKPKGRKTSIYSVRKDHQYVSKGVVLGEIRWYGAFRQYVFYPDEETVWSRGCLEIINRFLKKINDRHRKKLRKVKA